MKTNRTQDEDFPVAPPTLGKLLALTSPMVAALTAALTGANLAQDK